MAILVPIFSQPQCAVKDPIWLQDEEGFSSSSDDDEKEGGKGSKGSKEVV